MIEVIPPEDHVRNMYRTMYERSTGKKISLNDPILDNYEKKELLPTDED